MNWTTTGRHRGLYIADAFTALEAITSTASLVVEVLDAIHVDSQLSETLEFRALFDDLKVARQGVEWQLERSAMAGQKAEDFRAEWPRLRIHVIESQAVAMCSAAEQFVKMVLVEFPTSELAALTSSCCPPREYDELIDSVDVAYRKRLKKLQSASKTWLSFCNESCIPLSAKRDVADWARSPAANLVDELVLIRNLLVHAGGIMNPKLAARVGCEVGERARVGQSKFSNYSRAFYEFSLRLYPVL